MNQENQPTDPTRQTNDRDRLIEDLFHRAHEIPATQRQAFIDQVRLEHPELADEFADLLVLDHPEAADPAPHAVPAAPAAKDRFVLPPQTLFGHCRIISVHDTGGMGQVYLAYDLKGGERRVAVKVLLTSNPDPDASLRFKNEPIALSRLIHPNIAQLYYSDTTVWQGVEFRYFVMEFVDGKKLSDYIREHRPSLKERIKLMRKIAAAVHFSHIQGVYHRDLKPDNILVTPAGEPKIIDYGISVLQDDGPSESPTQRARANMGTLEYMAPEQFKAGDFEPDGRTDIYALGVIAFQVFVGRLPGFIQTDGQVLAFDSVPHLQLGAKIASMEREKLRQADRDLPRDLSRVVSKAMSRSRDGRYRDARALAEDLMRVPLHQPVEAHPDSSAYRARLFCRRHWLRLTGAVAVMAGLITAVIGLAVGESRALAALDQKSAALRAEAVARQLAVERSEEARRQTALTHARSAELAEQHGNWEIAYDEFQAAEQAGYSNQLDLAVGELRVLSRMDRPEEAEKLIFRVRTLMPAVEVSPQYQLVKGLHYWSGDPVGSVKSLQAALAQGGQLNEADRAFAEALVTSDLNKVSSSLRLSLKDDPFNRDGWALLSVTDLALGDARQCEMDAGVMRALFPADDAPLVMQACATAFQERRADAIALANNNPSLPPSLRATLLDLIKLICDYQNNWEGGNLSIGMALSLVNDIRQCAASLTRAHAMPIPITFQPVVNCFSPAGFTRMLLTGKDPWDAVNALVQTGMSELSQGVHDFQQQRIDLAITHLKNALSGKSLINYRRVATLTLAAAYWSNSKISPQERTRLIKQCLDQLIDQGGIHPTGGMASETVAIDLALTIQSYTQARSLTYGWLSQVPDDPNALFYLGQTEKLLGNSAFAVAALNQAIAGHLDPGHETAARTWINELQRSSASTQPTTRPALQASAQQTAIK